MRGLVLLPRNTARNVLGEVMVFSFVRALSNGERV
jgi:hypothetical protein